MSEYPEHIDQIDDFYRSQLADHEIEPPAGLWDKISANAFETTSPEAQATIGSGSSAVSSLLTSTQKLIGIGTATLLIVAGTFYWYSNKTEQSQTESETPPAVEKPLQTPQDSVNSTETTTDEEQVISPTHSAQEKNNVPSSINKVEESSVTPDERDESNSQILPENKVIAEPDKTRTDTIADIQTTPKVAPKEKVKFKDKYKKEYQDSTRKIFVPGK